MHPRTLAILALIGLMSPTVVRSAPTPMFSDAAIRAVHFVDRNEGWATGDDGVIWHSIDGGTTWERQPSGVQASLRSIHFMTPYTGWVVGRQETPRGSVGVVLITTDGGLKWTQIGLNALPGLNCVRFFDGRNGIVAGDGSDAYPTGVFTTTDGGQTWRAMPGPRCPSWLAGDFQDPKNGILAGAWSRLAPLHEGQFGVAEVDSLGGRSVNAVKVQGTRAVAVGQGGLILVSRTSGGVRWGFATPRLPREILGTCDFTAVSVLNDHIWIVGRPGTVVFHSPDFGKSWEVQTTGQSLPLHTIQFMSETEGWAAGELGRILVTKDGGKSWKVAREGGQRAAVLAVHARGADVPLDTMALLGLEEGYLTTALQVTSYEPSGASAIHAMSTERLRSAVRAVGGASAEGLWQFPLATHLEGRTQAQLLEAWNPPLEDRAGEELLRQLVLTLRMWRPEVVVTDAMSATPGNDPVNSLVSEAVKEAFKLASDPKQFPEQIELLKLAPWASKKMYTSQPTGTQTQVQHDLMEVHPRCADSLRNFASSPLTWLEPTATLPRQRYYRLLASRLPAGMNHVRLMEGVDLAFGGTGRRAYDVLPPAEVEQSETVRQAVERWSKIEQLARGVGQTGETLVTPDQVLAQLAPTLKNMPTEQGARAAFALATEFAQSGQWHLARETYLLTANQYPAHPLAIEAYRWLVRYQASSEARRRQELGQFLMTTETSTAITTKQLGTTQVRNAQEIVQAHHISMNHDPLSARKWYQGSLELEPKLAAFGPMYASDPAMQLCLHSSRRHLLRGEEAMKWYRDYLKATAGGNLGTGADPYRDCVLTEVWMQDRTMPTPPKPITQCRRIDAKPHLDGKLGDACWNDAKALTLRDAVGITEKTYATQVKWLCDGEHLYLALICHHPKATPAPRSQRRKYDSDLRGFDRVSIQLDLDRDYQTSFNFHVDQRGMVADDCWGDKTWNPRWFVAVEDSEEGWTAEIAIPVRELSAEPLSSGKAWAVNVIRTVPGKGVQSWSQPADLPEGMGVLQFVEK